MPNLIGHAAGLLEDKAVSVIVWSGAGVAIPKTISCAEIVKRQFNIPHQVTRLNYKTYVTSLIHAFVFYLSSLDLYTFSLYTV